MNADEVRRTWAERSAEYSPGYYAYYGPNETSERVRKTFDGFLEPDAAILELGCSSGRHLAHLQAHGYTNLHGLDVNDDAFDVMAAEYPELAEAVTFHHGAIESLVADFEDGQFDAVFSVETLQHVHADEAWAFEELVRITDDLLVTVECEGPEAEGTEPGSGHDGTAPVNYENGDFPLYYREWEEIFTGFGMEQVDVEPAGGDTMRVFRQA